MKRAWMVISICWATCLMSSWAMLENRQSGSVDDGRRQLVKQVSLLAGDALATESTSFDLNFLHPRADVLGAVVTDAHGQLRYRYGQPVPSGTELNHAVVLGGQVVGSVTLWFEPAVESPGGYLLPIFLALLASIVLVVPEMRAVDSHPTPPTGDPAPLAPMGALTTNIHEALRTGSGENQSLARELAGRLRSAAGLVLELNADHRIESVGGSLERFGFEKQDLLGRPVGFLVEKFEADDAGEFRTDCFTKEGGKLPATVSVLKVEDPGGNGQRQIVLLRHASGSDIQARERLLELESLYRGLCDNANDLILVLAPDGTIVYANPSWCRAAGYDGEQTTGLPMLYCIAGEYRLSCQDAFHQALLGEHPPARELHILRPDGKTVIIEGSFHCSLTPDGQPTSVIAIFRDLTQQRAVASALVETEERFRHSQKMEAIGRMAGGVAHDFNNLLTVIFSYANFIEADVDDPEEVLKSVKELQATGRKAASLTKQLLLFSRRQNSHEEVVSLNNVITDLSRLAKRIIGERVELKLALEAGNDRVLADSSQLEQVLMNLIVNATDAMDGRGVIEVTTADRELPQNTVGLEPGHYVELTVADNGCGIPPHLLKRIFEPYFTTKNRGDGTGLGLSTVYAIVEGCNGRIEARSRDTGGTEFSILLPRCEGSAQEDPSSLVVDWQGSGERILLVEDEDGVRKVIAKMLENAGYDVLVAADAEAGLALLQEHGSDVQLLVTDLVLPNMSGPELAREYASLYPEGKILYISGYPADTIEKHGLPGNGAFLPKPFRRAELGLKLRELLEHA